jgi:hypothetical protein
VTTGRKSAHPAADSSVVKRTAILLVALAAACAAVAGDSLGAASSYPNPLDLTAAASSVTGSWTLGPSGGTADATTSNVSTDGAVDDGWYVFAPGAQSTTRIATLPTVPDASGWIVDPAGGATGFPAGNWTFTVDTAVPGGTLDPGLAVLTVGIWKGTVSGGAFTPTGTILTPTDDPGGQDLRSDFAVSTSVTYALPKFSLSAGETLYVELWRHQVDGISDATDANREVDLVVDDGVTRIDHPDADDTPPTHALAVTGITGQSLFDSGSSTLYYDGAADGSFTVDDTLADTGSGALQVTYPDVATAGWTHAAETVTTGPDFTSGTYTWTAGSTASPGAQSIVGEDNALQTSTVTLTLIDDSTGPTGQTVSLVGGPAFSSLSVPLLLDPGTDAGVGVDTGSGVVERATGTPSNGTCSSFGSFAAVVLTGTDDDSVSTGNCYRYRYQVSDLLGNQTASASSADAIVDTTAPTITDTAPTESTGAGDQYWDSATDTLYFRPAASGSFLLNASGADAESGVARVAFPDVSATSGWSGSTGGTDTSASFTSPQAYRWTAGAVAPAAQQATATNGSGLTASDTITFTADSTAPTGQTVALGGGPWYATASVPLTLGTGSDTGSGVDGSRGVVERASATLTNGACGTFGAFAAVTLNGGADTTVVSGHCYRYQYKATDNVGNVSTASTASAEAKVDTTPPTGPTLVFTGLTAAAASGSTLYYRPSASGSFTVTAASSDPDSGVASYTFPVIAGFTTAGTGVSRTYTFADVPSAPLAPLAVTATGGSGLTSPAATFSLVPDPTPPTVTVACNGKPCAKAPYAKAVTVTMTASDGTGSGVDSIRYTTDGSDPTGDSGSEYTKALTVIATTHLKVRAYDRAGNPSALLAVTVASAASRLVFAAPVRVVVKAKARYVQARVRTSARATVAAVMSGKGLKKPQRWRFTLAAGSSIVQLRLPAAIRRPGTYSVRWNVTAGARKTARATRVALRK